MSRGADHGRSELVDALGAIAFAVMGALTRLAAEHDLSLTQVRMLGILRDRQLTISQLAGALGLDPSSVSGLVDRTEKRGLVQRGANAEDRRSVLVTVSRAGAEAVARGATELERLVAPLTGALSPAEAVRLTALLERMLEHRGL